MYRNRILHFIEASCHMFDRYNSVQMTQKRKNLTFKVILIGEPGTGKTSLIQIFTLGAANLYQSKRPVTVGVEFATTNITIENKTITLQIWDTSGQAVYRAITKNFYRGTAAIFLVYSIADRSSFQRLEDWFKEFREHGSQEALVILVGTKCDLPREVEANEAFNLLKKVQGSIYFETCSISKLNVREVFTKAAEIMYKTYEISKSYRLLVNPQLQSCNNSYISLEQSRKYTVSGNGKKKCC